MTPWKQILFIILGAILFFGGAFLAFHFYSFPVLPVMTITIWRDVTIFSILSLIGAAILIFTIRKIICLRHQAS